MMDRTANKAEARENSHATQAQARSSSPEMKNRPSSSSSLRSFTNEAKLKLEVHSQTH